MRAKDSDPHLTASVYEFEDSLTKERTVVDASRLRYGFDTALQPPSVVLPRLDESVNCSAQTSRTQTAQPPEPQPALALAYQKLPDRGSPRWIRWRPIWVLT